MFPDIEGYTRVKSIFTGRTTYYKGGSGNPNMDGLIGLFQLDRTGGRIISMIILAPFVTMFSASWGSDLLGSRGAVVFGVFGLILGLLLGYLLAERFTIFLGATIVLAVSSLAIYVIWSLLTVYWYADDPAYPSARQIRTDVMGEPLNCRQVERDWKGIRIFELNRNVLNTQHAICQNPTLIQLDKQLYRAFEQLDSIHKNRRENAQSTLRTFRYLVFQCESPDSKLQCIRDSYVEMLGIIDSAMHPPI